MANIFYNNSAEKGNNISDSANETSMDVDNENENENQTKSKKNNDKLSNKEIKEV